MRNSETLRTALFSQIEGLQNGTVKPETAKATASCAMAICKTVELDLKADDQLKERGLKSLTLTSTAEQKALPSAGVEIVPASETDGREIVLKAHASGLDIKTIAARTGLPVVDVELIIEAHKQAA